MSMSLFTRTHSRLERHNKLRGGIFRIVVLLLGIGVVNLAFGAVTTAGRAESSTASLLGPYLANPDPQRTGFADLWTHIS